MIELDNGVLIEARHCERPLRLKSTVYGWVGDVEIATTTLECETCREQVTVRTRIEIGPPSGMIPP